MRSFSDDELRPHLGRLTPQNAQDVSLSLLETLTAADVQRIPPSAVSAFSVRQLNALPPEILARLNSNQVQALTPEQINALPATSLRGLTLQQLDYLTDQQVIAITGQQLRALQPSQVAALAPRLNNAQVRELSEEARQQTTSLGLRRSVRALNPGVRLVGDGYAQLVSTASESDADASFGAGVQVEHVGNTFHLRSHMVIRKGTRPTLITDRDRMGLSILTPNVEDLFAGVTMRMRWAPTASTSWVFGPVGRLAVARSEWGLTVERATMDMPNLEPLQVVQPAITFTGALGASAAYVLSQSNNYVELSLDVLVGFRGVALGAGADAAYSEAVGLNPERGRFLEAALGTRQGAWLAIEVEPTLRLNELEISALVQYVVTDGPEVSGLTGWTFIPSIAVRTGPQLIDL